MNTMSKNTPALALCGERYTPRSCTVRLIRILPNELIFPLRLKPYLFASSYTPTEHFSISEVQLPSTPHLLVYSVIPELLALLLV